MMARLIVIAATISILGWASAATAGPIRGFGEWKSSSGGDAIHGTWSSDLSENEGQLSGTVQLTGSNVLQNEQVTGSVEHGRVVLGSTAAEEMRVSFDGEVADGKISGHWQFPDLHDEGTWSGQFGPTVQLPAGE